MLNDTINRVGTIGKFIKRFLKFADLEIDDCNVDIYLHLEQLLLGLVSVSLDLHDGELIFQMVCGRQMVRHVHVDINDSLFHVVPRFEVIFINFVHLDFFKLLHALD